MEVLQDAKFLDAIKAKNFQDKTGAKFMKGDQFLIQFFRPILRRMEMDLAGATRRV